MASHYTGFLKLPIEKNTILYECSNGAGMVCNPYAIFKAFIKDDSFEQYKHIWVISDEDELLRLKNEYKQFNNVFFVNRLKSKGREYARYCATANFFVQNTSFPWFFSKREGQIYLNTWHSITVKTLGYDMTNGIVESRNMLRNLLQSDYIISANSFMTDIFKKSYKLDGLYNGVLIEEGHPRTDTTLKSEKAEIIEKLKSRGISVSPTKKIILYAPTWRGASVAKVVNDANEYRLLEETMYKALGSDEYQVLIKPHPFVYRGLSEEQKASGRYIPSYVDTNELLSVVDILISDYSSIYFDFMMTGRPILFYIPDLEEYSAERGLYFKPEELPGPSTNDLDELGELVKSLETVKTQYSQIYEQTKKWAIEHDNGSVGQKIIDIVFKDKKQYNIIQGIDNKKTKILFYAGEFAVNGLTEVFLTFVNNMDYDKYDVTICCMYKNMKNVERITSNARILMRYYTYTATLKEFYNMQNVFRFGLVSKHTKKADIVFRRDFVRCFGNAQFDYAVDFSGYGVFFAALLSQAIGAKKYIWQHNDLSQDLNNKKKIALKRGDSATVESLLSMYSRYDKVVSVGETLMKINRENISNKEVFGKYAFVNNPINTQRIKEGLNHAIIEEEYDDTLPLVTFNSLTGELAVRKLIKNVYKVPKGKGAYKFVAMGRFSPEKNHINLIKAFEKFLYVHPRSVLYIIGHGAMKKEMVQLVKELDIQEKVIFTGNMENPFILMSYCDCFIMPSIYEGQGIVVLEARLLNLPIIMSNYSVVQANCLPNGQLIIGMEENDIYEGMVAFVDGKVPSDYHFDGDAYNAECYRQFEGLF